MTVISTVLSKNQIVVASDGYITNAGNPLKSDATKFVRFDHVKCVASYWGLASYRGWSMERWLNKQNEYLTKHPEWATNLKQLAKRLQTELEKVLTIGILKDVARRGIGIHLAGFEQLDAKTTSPELFLITNFSIDKDGYYYVQQNTLDCTRRTIVDFVPRGLKLRSIKAKKKYVNETILKKGSVIIFNNGDPIMFNAFSIPIKRARSNGKLRKFDDHELLKHFAAWPIEKVKEFQREFYDPTKIVVGGKISVNILTANGEWI